jgi:hypothetical protein
MYYYYCKCCDGTTTKSYVNASTGYNYGPTPNIPCGDTRCIGTCAKLSPLSVIYQRSSPFKECPFHLDPTANDLNGNLHAAAFKFGIKAQKSAVLDAEIRRNKTALTTVSAAAFVRYDDNGTVRYVALYDITNSTAGHPACDLHMGSEVSDQPTGATQPDEWGIPFKLGFPYHHHVYQSNHRYHVVIAKSP